MCTFHPLTPMPASAGGTLRRNKRYVEIAPAPDFLQILERTAAGVPSAIRNATLRQRGHEAMLARFGPLVAAP
jgi:hypothetical protein